MSEGVLVGVTNEHLQGAGLMESYKDSFEKATWN